MTARIASPFPARVDPGGLRPRAARELHRRRDPEEAARAQHRAVRRCRRTRSSSGASISTRPASCRRRTRCRAFLADARPDKRARLIDALLERPEFVDYWAYKWSDLLLVSSRSLQSNAMWAYYNWIRASVAANKPWDVMAREILTASGNALSNGAANYYVLHKNPVDVTENVAVTFMGFSITCARCHNHPLERWTQKDYYQMANLFSRVADQERRPSAATSSSIPARTGDINHPRLNVPLPPRPLDGRPLPLDSAAGPPAVLRRLAGRAGQSVLRARDGQPRLEELHGTRPGRGGGRHPRRQPAVEPGAARGADARFRRAPASTSSSWCGRS